MNKSETEAHKDRSARNLWLAIPMIIVGIAIIAASWLFMSVSAPQLSFCVAGIWFVIGGLLEILLSPLNKSKLKKSLGKKSKKKILLVAFLIIASLVITAFVYDEFFAPPPSDFIYQLF